MSQDEFEAHRGMLEGLAYRMCGVWAEAQDIVQETHIKWSSAEQARINNPRAWLVTVCSRLAMDVLKSARVQRERYVGTWLPEPVPAPGGTSTDTQAKIDDSVSMALLVAMERLSPFERAAFLLHDVFGYGFREIASITGKAEAACRKSAARARTAVRKDRPRFEVTPEKHQRLLDAFFEAVHVGEPDRLKALLAESIEFYSDGGGRVKTALEVVRGRDAVAAFFLEIWRENVRSRESIRIVNLWFNGTVGALLYRDRELLAAFSIEVEDSQIKSIFAQRNPDKLAGLAEFKPEQG